MVDYLINPKRAPGIERIDLGREIGLWLEQPQHPVLIMEPLRNRQEVGLSPEPASGVQA